MSEARSALVERSALVVRDALTAVPTDSQLVEFQALPITSSEYAVRGDFNGDGFVDRAFGDWTFDDGSFIDTGRVLVYTTDNCGGVPEPTPSQIFRPGVGGLPSSSVRDGRFGFALAVGDFNADGFEDLAIGMPGIGGAAQTYVGAVYVLHGSSAGLTPAGSARFTQDTPEIQETAEGGDGFGHALTSADFDGDGFDDLAIGVPFEARHGLSQTGVVQVVRGSANGLTASGNQLFDRETVGIAGSAVAGDRFGYSVAAGRFHSKSGYSDLAVGVLGADDAARDAGAVHVLAGSAAGLTSFASLLFHEESSGVNSAAAYGEGFGYGLDVWDDNHDGVDDLVVHNSYASDCDDDASHLLFGSASGINASNDLYACGKQRGPRFEIGVDPPGPPSTYAVPQSAVLVNNVSDLVTRLTNGTRDVIVLADGVYDNANVVVPNAADQIWAQHLGAAILRFGLYYNFEVRPNTPKPELHGLTFDLKVVDLARVIDSNGEFATIVQAAANDDPTTGTRRATSLVVEDCFFYGHDWIDRAVHVARPDQLTLRRLIVRDTHDFGISLSNVEGPVNKPSMVLSDLDIAGVFRPPGEAGTNGKGLAEDLYYCKREAGIVLDQFDHVELERVRVRNTRCAGILLGVNEDEASADAGSLRHLDVDCAGYWPDVMTSAGVARPVRNASIYLQQASNLALEHLVIGASGNDGIRSEWTAGKTNAGISIDHALIAAQRVGVFFDACTQASSVSNYEIDGAKCAGVADNNEAATWNKYCSGYTRVTNAFTSGLYHLPAQVPAEMHQNANTCSDPSSISAGRGRLSL